MPRFLVSPSLSYPVGLSGPLPFHFSDCGGSPSSQIGLLPSLPPGYLASSYPVNNLNALAPMDPTLELKSPKIEPFSSENGVQTPLMIESPGFHHLPALRSLEQPPDPMDSSPCQPPVAGDPIYLIEPSQKRFRPASEISRRRRKNISDRTRILEGLMPWEKKKDTATMLEDASKYIRFLEAQVTALQTMPVCSAWFAPVIGTSEPAINGLSRLNRQQLLQVLVNSPVVQDKLYVRGVCVFSVEQVTALRRAAALTLSPPMLLLGAAAVDDEGGE
ncbi:transcription factor bHLH117 [Typha angustifolia]|uniref:transcription factor bHLH117 n=1 Tax=Typha angustifolia TaxID=59011 RepID=UPI003C308D6A